MQAQQNTEIHAVRCNFNHLSPDPMKTFYRIRKRKKLRGNEDIVRAPGPMAKTNDKHAFLANIWKQYK